MIRALSMALLLAAAQLATAAGEVTAPAPSLGTSTAPETVLKADARGHFVTIARINGYPVRALIDTGATHVSISAALADKAGIDYLGGKQVTSVTAGGRVKVYLINIAHVQVGSIAFANVTGSVRMDDSAPTLIGMSYLKHLEMRRIGDTMTLIRTDQPGAPK